MSRKKHVQDSRIPRQVTTTLAFRTINKPNINQATTRSLLSGILYDHPRFYKSYKRTPDNEAKSKHPPCLNSSKDAFLLRGQSGHSLRHTAVH